MNDRRVTSPQLSYKVWLEIEQFDTTSDSYRNLDTPGAAIAEFATYGEARAFVESANRLMRNVLRSEKGPSPGRS